MRYDRLNRIVCALLMVLFLGASAMPQAAHAGAVITVNDTCTLADAITAANTDTAVGGCPAGEGDDTLELTADVILTGVDNEADGPNGLPSIETDLTLEGNGFTIARADGAPEFRLLHLTWGVITIHNVTLRGGSVTGEEQSGGCVYNRGSALNISEVTITDCSASAEGGGIYSVGSITILRSLLANNTAEVGGAICHRNWVMRLEDSTLSGNTASGPGGAIFSSGMLLDITNSTLSDNVAERGGAIAVGIFTDAKIAGSTLSGNTATLDGGGIYTSGKLRITGSTLDSNQAAWRGGGLFLFVGEVEVASSTLYNNATFSGGGIWNEFKGTLRLVNSIVASKDGGDCVTGPESVSEGSANLDSDGSCPDSQPIIGLDPALADHGGPTLTHALLEGSNAIDAGDPPFCPETDQRGAARVGPCDIGAFEFAANPPAG